MMRGQLTLWSVGFIIVGVGSVPLKGEMMVATAIDTMKAREVLQGLREQFLNKARRMNVNFREVTEARGKNIADLAHINHDAELYSSLEESDRRELVAIDAALSRIENGSYGVCPGCDDEISRARLSARPQAVLCSDCQRNQEEKNKKRKASF